MNEVGNSVFVAEVSLFQVAVRRVAKVPLSRVPMEVAGGKVLFGKHLAVVLEGEYFAFPMQVLDVLVRCFVLSGVLTSWCRIY